MTVPALVHQMSFAGSVSGMKRKMTAFEDTYGWHLTTKKHRNGGSFLDTQSTDCEEREWRENVS